MLIMIRMLISSENSLGKRLASVLRYTTSELNKRGVTLSQKHVPFPLEGAVAGEPAAGPLQPGLGVCPLVLGPLPPPLGLGPVVHQLPPGPLLDSQLLPGQHRAAQTAQHLTHRIRQSDNGATRLSSYWIDLVVLYVKRSILFLFCLNLGPLGPLQDREG